MAAEQDKGNGDLEQQGRSLPQRAVDRLRRLLGVRDLAADAGETYRATTPDGAPAAGAAKQAQDLDALTVGSGTLSMGDSAVGSVALRTEEAPEEETWQGIGPVGGGASGQASGGENGAATGGGWVAEGGADHRAPASLSSGAGGRGGGDSAPLPPLSTSGSTAGLATEDGQLIATGQIVAQGGWNAQVQPGTYQGKYGLLVVEPSGHWTYHLDNADPDVQQLNNGQQVQDHFQCMVVDGTGKQLPVPIVVGVSGTDDAAVISGARTGSVTEDLGPQQAAGQLIATDIDRGDQPSFVPHSVQGLYGTFELKADGHWDYTVDPQKIQGLKAGEQKVETFEVSTTNAQQESVSAKVNIAIVGTDDKPIFPPVSLSVKEDDGTVTGHLVATDVDAEKLFYGPAPGTVPPAGISVDPDGKVHVDPSQPAYQGLAAGEYRDLQIPVQVTDERGVAVPSLLTVRVEGTNDAPVVTVRPPLPVDEGSGVHSVQVLATDVDTTDTLTYATQSGVPLPVGVSLDPSTGLVSIDTNHPAYNSLGVGETRTLVLPVVVSDGHGGSTTTQVSLELHGTNDAPILAAIGQRTATEGDAPINGQLSAIDPDTNDKLTYGVAAGIQLPAGFSIQSDGHWTFDPQDPAYNALRAGDHQQLLIPLQVSDGHGGVSTQTLALDLTGTNDRALISGTSTGSVTEDRTLQAAGVLSIVDPDAGEAQFKPSVLNGLYGQLHLNADGSWTYTLDNTNPKVQALPAGGSLSDQLLVLSADGTAHQVRVQISGTDDAAQVSGTTTGQVREDVVMTASGQLTVRDIDQGETPVFQSETLQGIYGQLSIDATGQWHYQLDPAASQQLQDGVKARESFTVLASDGKGHQVSQQVLVDITGTNDAARISGTASGQVTEDALTKASGKLDVQDVDRGEAHFQAGDQSGSYGSLHLDTDGTWQYTLDNNSPRVQELPAGASATETFTVSSADGTTHQLTVQISGQNDAARISGTSSGQVTEDALTQASGKLDVQDVDRGEAHFQAGDQSGSYGSLHLSADGTWGYTLDNSNPKVQELPAGASATETFTVRSADGTTHQLTVQIAGQNDAATISGSSSGRVTEDGTLQATGQLQVSDADRQQSAFDPNDVGDKVGTYGTLHLNADGSWTYQLNNSAKAVQDLQAGDTRQDSFTVHSVDGTSHQLQMTVVGASDAPVLSAGQISGGREDNSFTLSQDQILKALQATDPDGDRMTVASVRYAGGDATLVDNHNGTWTLTPHANWAGDLSLQVGVSDGHDTTSGTLMLPIAAVADKVTMTVAPSLSSNFEDPTLGGQMFHFADPTQWGWHTDNASGKVEVGKGEAYGDPNHANTGVIELEGNANEKDNLYREIPTQPGAKYEFGLDVSGRSNTAGRDAAVEVWWEGHLIDTITPADHTFGFVHHTYQLVAHGDQARIEFKAVTHDGCGPVVDNPNFVFRGFSGTEDTPLPIRLSVETADKDGSETVTTSIKGLPAGFVISDGTTGHQLTSSGETQVMDMQGWDLQHIVVTPLPNFHGDVNAVLVATSTEASNHDQSSTQIPVTLNFAGVNDNPTVQITSGTALQEGSSGTSREQVSSSDIDGDTTSVDSAWLSSHGWSSSDGGVSYTKAGTYGTATVTVASGQVSYQLNNAAGSATDQLSEGQSGRDEFQVQITDGHQGSAVGMAIFNVQGTNDAPVVSAGTATPLTEGSSGTATSILMMRDPDTNDPAPTVNTTWLVNHGWSTTDGGSTYTKAGTYGTATLNLHTSTVSYHLDNTAGGATDRLAEGQSVHDDFGIQVVDSHDATAMVTPTFGVTGTNDAPSVSASNPSLGTATEEKDGVGSPVVFTEQQLLAMVGATDRDGGDSLHVTHVTAEGGFGSFAKLANGNWQYTPPADAHKANVSVSVTVEDTQKGSSTAQAVLDVRPATDSAKASLVVTTEAQVMHFSAAGQHAFKETGAGQLNALSLEVMAVGDPNNKGGTTGTTGQVLFNLSAPGNSNIISLWRPAALSIAFHGTENATNPPLDLTTGQHRLTLTWDSASGVLTLYDNGKEYQHWNGINQGGTIPSGTIATVGQKMNNPGLKTGFSDGEQFHGDLFSVTLASQKVGAADVNVPLANLLPASQLLMDLREANGQVVDTLAATSTHPITKSNVGTATQQVSTTASLPPSGARLNLNVSVSPPADGDDHISRELLRGLPPGTVLSDGSGGHSFTVPANGEVNVLTDLNGWQHLDQLSAQLPSNYRQNLPLQLVVETTGPNGAISRVSSDTSVLFDPSAQTPALPALAAVPDPAPSPPPPTPGSQHSPELQDLLQQLQTAGVTLTETQLATSHHHSDPQTGVSSDVLELHTDHGTVLQTLTTHADGTTHVALDTTGLDDAAKAALPVHTTAAATIQPQQADVPEQHDRSPDLMDQGLDPSSFQLDQVAPAALQAAVHSLSTADPADLPSFSSTGPLDPPGHSDSDNAPASDNAAIDAEQLAQAAQQVASAPLTTETDPGNSNAPGAEAIPISAPSDPLSADPSSAGAAPDEVPPPVPPLPDQNHDQSLDHLSSLS